MEYILAPSILSADFNILGQQIHDIEQAGAKYLHFDVMDGHFVDSISFGMPVLTSIRNSTHMVMDVHLMVEEPIRYVHAFSQAGADILTVHVEACSDLLLTVNAIRHQGMKVGVTLRPETPIERIFPILPHIDMALIMSVSPGYGGQPFIPESYERIKKLRERIINERLQVDIEVDGGINIGNVEDVIKAGANVIVAGSAVFHGDIVKNVKSFMEHMQ